MESSIRTTLFPFTTSEIGLSFILTLSSLDFCLAAINVLPMYLFFINVPPPAIESGLDVQFSCFALAKPFVQISADDPPSCSYAK